ncbi:MAG: MarR family transcriptional regulator [Deinococcota bacterium]
MDVTPPSAQMSSTDFSERDAAGTSLPLRFIGTLDAAVSSYKLNYLANNFLGPLIPALKKRWNLSRTEFSVLYCLRQAGRLTAKDICEITGRPKNSVSRAVHTLLKRSIVSQQLDASDGRRMILTLTTKGKHLYKEIIPLFEERERVMLACLSAEEQEALEHLLNKLVASTVDWAEVY